MKGLKRKFKRQCFWLKKLGEKWRKPRGRQSKLRKQKGGRWAVPKVGYGSQATERGTIMVAGKSMKAFMVSNPDDLGKINPETGVGVISSSVGIRKSNQIIEKAAEMKIKIINRKIKKAEFMKKSAKKEDAKKQDSRKGASK